MRVEDLDGGLQTESQNCKLARTLTGHFIRRGVQSLVNTKQLIGQSHGRYSVHSDVKVTCWGSKTNIRIDKKRKKKKGKLK